MSMNFNRVTERVALVVVAVVAVVLVGASLRFERHMANQQLLYYQLLAIRTSVNLFKALNKTNPNNLSELVVTEYSFEGENMKRHYLETLPTNQKGEIIDPFGAPYHYDKATGWVRSATSGYEYW